MARPGSKSTSRRSPAVPVVKPKRIDHNERRLEALPRDHPDRVRAAEALAQKIEDNDRSIQALLTAQDRLSTRRNLLKYGTAHLQPTNRDEFFAAAARRHDVSEEAVDKFFPLARGAYILARIGQEWRRRHGKTWQRLFETFNREFAAWYEQQRRRHDGWETLSLALSGAVGLVVETATGSRKFDRVEATEIRAAIFDILSATRPGKGSPKDLQVALQQIEAKRPDLTLSPSEPELEKWAALPNNKLADAITAHHYGSKPSSIHRHRARPPRLAP